MAQIEGLCQHSEESSESCPSNASNEEMTVLDRMALWSRKETEDPAQKTKKDSLFEGIRGMEEEDIARNAEMFTYRDFALSSTAYQWFIEILKKHLSLDWGSDDVVEANSCRLIHHSIMSKIPLGIHPRNRTMGAHRARFRIEMHPDVFERLERGPIAKLTTLTSSAPNIVQVSTVEDYLDQTWLSGGLKLAEVVQKACRCANRAKAHTGMSLTIDD